jgi:hypothetical protein
MRALGPDARGLALGSKAETKTAPRGAPQANQKLSRIPVATSRKLFLFIIDTDSIIINTINAANKYVAGYEASDKSSMRP